MGGFIQSLRALGPLRLGVMGLVAVAVIGLLLYVANRVTMPNFALLYGDLAIEDSGRIVSELDGLGVPYRLAANGGQILVPGDQVLRTRVRLAEKGLPSGGSVGYEVFDTSAGLGTTNFVQNINLLRALEGELARTISSLDKVQSARVHVVLPERQLFERERNEPSASVLVRQSGGGRMTMGEVAAIQHLVAAAVPGLGPARVAVVDGAGNLLASGTEDSADVGAMAARTDQFRRNFELRIKRALESMIGRSLGADNVRAEVSADVDFDRLTVNEEIFDPDGQVVRSTQSVEDTSSSSERQSNVSVGGNLPESAAGNAGGQVRDSAQRTEETVNFEISRTLRNHTQEGGTIKRLSVAVLVDGTYEVNAEDGTRTYVPRTDQELERIGALVRTAIGFDKERGDKVEVINMRFVEMGPVEEPLPPFLGLEKRDYLKIMEILVLAVVSILVILLVLRPLVGRMIAAMPTMRPMAGVPGVPGVPGERPMITGPEGVPIPAPEGVGEVPGLELEGEGDVDAMIDLDRVSGRVRASSLKKMGEIIDKHPDEALTIIRGWMAQSL